MVAMPGTFEILTRFLERFGEGVEGRELSALPPEVGTRLQRFARGELPAAEQADLIRELNEHPEWIASLAAEVKALRGAGRKN
jgi:hypothetical protein